MYLTPKLDEHKIGDSMRFRGRPSRIVLMDTYNNPFFPIPRPQLDKASFDLPVVFEQYRKIYGVPRARFLPWHYTVELVDDNYYVFQTRPLDLKFPLTWKEFRDFGDPDLLPKQAKQLFEREDFDTQIFIVVIGDSNYDVYPPKIYRVISEYILMPLRQQFKIHIQNDTINLLGNKFVFNRLHDK